MGRKLILIAFSLMVFVNLITIGMFIIKPDTISEVVLLDEGWDVTYNDTMYDDVSLSQLRKIIGTSTHKGDVIKLYHDDIDLSLDIVPTIMFESRFSAYAVYIDSELIERRFMNLYENDKFIGCQYNFVTLPMQDGKTNITIELYLAEDGAYNYFEAPILGSYSNVFTYEIYANSFFFLIGAFLIVFGIMFFAVAFGFRSSMPEINMQMYSALLYIVLGIWFLCQFRLLDLFVETHGHQTEIEYISLYMIVPLMYMVMGCMRNYLRKKAFILFVVCGTLVPATIIALHYLHVIHMNQLIGVYQLDAAILIGYMFVMILIIDAPRQRVSNAQYVQILGQGALALSFIINMIFFNLEINGVSEQIMLSKKIVPVGAMAMVFATMFNYRVFIAESLSRKKEYASLAHLAYADELTGIANRSKYEKYMERISYRGDDYCLVSIDLNGLKTINDNMGHLMGDKYLTDFGKALKECFGNVGFVARIGGDEFVAVLRGEKMARVEEFAEKLKNILENQNEADDSFNRSAALGYACRHECESDDFHSVYLLADERMYRNKQLTHSTRG